jgi:LmbE family N-acetylglucosaminyl deacetylase
MPRIASATTNSTPSVHRHSSLLIRSAKLMSRPKIYFDPEIKPSARALPVASVLLAATLFAASFIAPQPTQAQAPEASTGAMPQARAQQFAQLQDPANLTGERVSPADLADTLPIDHGAPALQQLLLKLRTRASFMLIVAHPDDEDGGMLTYLSRGQGARVAMLTLNRGEGGQNFMSADFDDALGLIRTQELLAADRYMGVDQFFGTEVDFGFSKTKEEAFAKWTHDRVLYDAVRAVRLYRPLVIASVFIGAPSDGHGQHQVAGEIAQEVFTAAGDPSVFPDQIAAGLQPWQPLKVYARVPFARIDARGMFDYATNQYVPARFTNYVTGRVTNTIPRANVVIPEGDPATYTAPDGTKTPIPGMEGLSYVQFAREGLALEKSQIGPNARLASPGPHDVAYTLYGSKVSCLQPIKFTSETPSNNSIPEISSNSSTQPSPNSLKPQTPARSSLSQASPNSGPLGTPSLQARVPPSPTADEALAPGVCPPSPPEPSLFTGIDTSFAGMATLVPEAADKFRPLLQKIDDKIAEAQASFDPAKPELIAPQLRFALGSVDQFIHELENPNVNDLDPLPSYNLLHELRIKRTELNNALILALGFDLKAVLGHDADKGRHAPVPLLTTDKLVSLTVSESNRSKDDIRIEWTALHPATTDVMIGVDEAGGLHPGQSRTENLDFRIDHPLAANRPYFSRKNIEQPFYEISNPNLRDAPATPPSLTVELSLDDQGVPLTLDAIVENTGDDRNQPAVAVPPVSLTVTPNVEILTPNFAGSSSEITVRTGNRQTSGKLSIEAPSGWKTSDPDPFSIANANEEYRDVMSASPTPDSWKPLPALPKGIPSGAVFKLSAIAEVAGTQYREGYRAVGYPGLTYTNYYTPSTYRVTAVDVHTAPDLQIAYLPGTGDDVPSSLGSFGRYVKILTTANLTTESLKPYDAVILGVRAYEHSDLAAANPTLNAYAAAGGIVIAQYNTGQLPAATGPYPLSLGDSEKVVEEDAPVHILAPTNPLLTWPNQITTADFDHWVEERGHGFMGTWDPHYEALLETHDQGQQPQLGGLLVARTGRGAWIYLGLALYRQLPEGVPGAYRILANLISAAKNPAFAK